jgi:hypothetical protein
MNVPQVGFDLHIAQAGPPNPESMRILGLDDPAKTTSKGTCGLASAQAHELDFHSDPSHGAIRRD